jgi:hypothetical protein
MNSYVQDLRRELLGIGRSLTITSPTSFVFAELPEISVEQHSDLTASGAGNQPAEDRQRRALVETLSDVLYWNCYVQRFGGQSARSLEPVDVAPDAEFQRELSKANQSQSRWDPGWSVMRNGFDGEVSVRKGDCHRAPVPGEFLFDARPGVRPQPGDEVSIRVTRESTMLQHGFYHCFSEQVPDQFEEFNSVRVYFNVQANGVATLLRELSGRLNRFQVPFRFKCPASPGLFNRRDSAVLYVPWRFFEPARRCVVDSLPQVEGFLNDDVPLFTKRVHRGVAMAEDPGELRSFGQYRCELMAEALIGALVDESRGGLDRSNPESAIERRFQQAGVSIEQPWLNPGSRDWLDLRCPQICLSESVAINFKDDSKVSSLAPKGVPDLERRDEKFLQVADRIGSRLCRDAFWSGTRCNWLEWDAEPFGTNWRPVLRALGPSPIMPSGGVSLYMGSAGIALFLARLYQFTGEAWHGETAVAAARQIRDQLSKLSDLPAAGEWQAGFYTGWFGAAWTLAEIGRQLDNEELVEAAAVELEKAVAAEPALPHTDIISGSAGLIVGLVDLAQKFDQPKYLEVALRHGEFLLDAAEKSDSGWSWETIDVPVHNNLTGYGHGVSGIVGALAELHQATGDDRFARAVREGLRYESKFFSEDDGNWRDHRKDVAPAGDPAFQFGWCHGAPGVGLARFRLLELGFDSELIQRDLRIATQTTIDRLSLTDRDILGAFCLCHGLAGNCELPLLLSQPDAPDVEPGRDEFLRRVDMVAQTGIELFEDPGIPWQCNPASTGHTPVLLNGMAGIGYFYLRAFAPRLVPSVLLLRPNHDS